MAQHVRPEPSARYCTAVVKREHGRQNQTRSSKKPIRGVPRETEGAAAPANYGRQRVHCRAQGRVEAPCRVASACRWSLEACPVMSIGQTCRPEIGPSGYRQHCLRSLALCRPVEVVRRTQAAPNFAGSPAEGSRKSEQRILHAVSVSSITSRCRFEVNNMLTIRLASLFHCDEPIMPSIHHLFDLGRFLQPVQATGKLQGRKVTDA